MNITVQKITDKDLSDRACKFTLHSHKDTTVPLAALYKSEHSPMRTQMYWIELVGIPSFVSVHLVRHNVGVQHYVQTNRDDRGADAVADRNTPVNHAMFINAQALINMSRKRMCHKAHDMVQEVMYGIQKRLFNNADVLANYLVPECMYRGGKCHEFKPCGYRYGV